MSKQSFVLRFGSRRFVVLISIVLLVVGYFLVVRLRDTPAYAQDELVPSIVVFSQNFDSLTTPALPAGWTTSVTGQIELFRTVSDFPGSMPNAVFTNDPNTSGTAELVSPPIPLENLPHKLIFRHFYQTDFEFDGCVLEISINGGTFTDIVNAGGVFVAGGYDTPLVGGTLAGRRAWTGQQSAYITTEVNLPPSTNGQSIRFRWRIGTDPMEAGTGWWIDDVQVTNAISAINPNAIAIPASGPASPYPSELTVTNHPGLVTDVQVNLVNFSHNVPDDVDLMLVAPNGKKVVLMSDVGGSNPVTNLNLFISDGAASSFPDSSAITSGTFRPTNFEPGDSFPAPGAAPDGARLSSLNGGPANGIWQLLLVDDSGANAGSISGGWRIFLLSSTDAIGIPDVGAATPYSSDRFVSGLPGTVTKATVTLTNFSHTAPDDVDLMLVAPNGRRVVLMSDAGGNTEVGNLSLTFDDAAASNLPDSAQITTGTFRPTDFEPGDSFPAPAPQGASGASLGTLYGSAPNGLWKLFAVDDTGANAGSIAGSWTINLLTSTTACAFTLSPSLQSFPITGGNGSFAINMPPNCSWSASTSSNFLTIDSTVSGSGNGGIAYTVSPNFEGGRAGSIDISNGVAVRSFEVQQPSGCPFSLNQSTLNFPASGGAGNVGVTAGNLCNWSATTTAPWVQIVSAPQNGNGTVAIDVSPNASSIGRSTTVTLGARSFVVNQAGATGRRFDFDGDAKADVSVFRPSTGEWYLMSSGQPGSYSVSHFGLSTDKLTPADFDGDRKTDVGVYRDGTWYVYQSQSNTVRVELWGLAGDVAVPGDYDGDGRADMAVYRPSDATWYVRRSTDSAYQAVAFGLSTDKPIPADFDGDGRMDMAVYRTGAGTSQWAILNSGNGSTSFQGLGISGDIAVPADFDGDGRDNIAVFRPSNGTWYTSTDPSTNYGARQWGTAGDIPVAADYDGNGRADYAVYRAGVWYILHSGTNAMRTEFWGVPSDTAVPSVFNRQ